MPLLLVMKLSFIHFIYFSPAPCSTETKSHAAPHLSHLLPRFVFAQRRFPGFLNVHVCDEDPSLSLSSPSSVTFHHPTPRGLAPSLFARTRGRRTRLKSSSSSSSARWHECLKRPEPSPPAGTQFQRHASRPVSQRRPVGADSTSRWVSG